jgi:uncharacterized protein (DUF1501 family)
MSLTRFLPRHAGCAEHVNLSRRQLMAGTTSLALWGLLPKQAIAGTRDPRFLTIILRGAVDGLALAAPVGDPDYVRLRGKLALPKDGTGAGLTLDGFFALNSAMPYLHSLYQKREAVIIHAVATPYRGRSHFDGQDVLESGLGGVAISQNGWLNRALGGLPHAGTALAQKGLAMGAVVPLVMRGEAPVMSWTPKANNLPLRELTIDRVMDLYAHTDPGLAKAFAEGMEIDRVATAGAATMQPTAMGTATMAQLKPELAKPTPAAQQPTQPAQPQPARLFRDFIDTAEAASKFMTTAGGPRIGALSFDGWDTHANEGVITGQLATKFAGLDAAIKAFAEGMGPAWRDTAVLIVTEFGRTARTNGTQGTDHGTGTVAILLGGAVKGGRVLADWPGLKETDLHEGRDLKPTRDLRTITKGILRDHLGIPDGALASTIFPGSTSLKPADGLMG